MSFPERTVILSPDAQDDFTDILLYTLQEWGEDQSDRYGATLQQAIVALGRFAEIGEPRPHLFSGCRIRRIGRHILYYRVLNGAVEIVRILHERTNPTRRLPS